VEGDVVEILASEKFWRTIGWFRSRRIRGEWRLEAARKAMVIMGVEGPEALDGGLSGIG